MVKIDTRAQYINLIILKMDYTIMKTKTKDELDIYKCNALTRYNSITPSRLKIRLSNIELILVEIDRRIENCLIRMPTNLECEVEHPLRIHLQKYLDSDGNRIPGLPEQI